MIKPLDDKILVEMPDLDAQVPDQVIQAVSNKSKMTFSKVIAVGPGSTDSKGKFTEMPYKAGDTVFYPTECVNTSVKTKLPDGTPVLFIVVPQVLCYIPAQQ